jgi:hypothetical protein
MSGAAKSLSPGDVSAAFPARLFSLTQPQDQKAVMIIALDGCVLDRARELNHFFKPAVSDLELVMRDPFSANTVAAQSADAQDPAVKRDLNISGPNPSKINFHDPAIVGAIHIGRRDPQTPGWTAAAVARALDYSKVTIKWIAGHNDSSAQKSLEVSGENRWVNYKGL